MSDPNPSVARLEGLEIVAVWVTVLGDVLGAIATTGLYLQAQAEQAESNVSASTAGATGSETTVPPGEEPSGAPRQGARPYPTAPGSGAQRKPTA